MRYADGHADVTRGGHSYPFGYGDEELRRLGKQHRVWQEENQRLLSRAGFGQGDTLVDLGCGPGFTTLDLARRVGPMGRVIAEDRRAIDSPGCTRRQTRRASGNVEARVADLEQFDLPPESVDGVYGRRVLMYLPEREARALATRIAKWPGRAARVLWLSSATTGTSASIRPWSISSPSRRRSCGPRQGSVAAIPRSGCVLPGVLDAAGLDVELRVATKVIRPATQDWRWPDTLFRQILPLLVDQGQLAGDILDDFFARWDARSRDPSAIFFSSPVLEVIGRRQENDVVRVG